MNQQEIENQIKAISGNEAVLEKHDFEVVYQERVGGHTWVYYLEEFAQLLHK